jgi:aldose 1-epimerase
MSETTIELSNDKLILKFVPSIGATITAFQSKREGSWIDIMRRAPQPLGRSSNGNFIMLPYSNRIRDAVFVYNDEHYQLDKVEKHAIHGDVRDRPWEIVEQSKSHARLEILSSDFPDFNFPFPIRAEVTYTLENNSLHVDLLVQNLSNNSIPAGFGLHPYFNMSLGNQSERPSISFSATGYYAYEGDLPIANGDLEETPEAFSFSKSREIVSGIDHCYGGWSGKAEILWPSSKVALEITSDQTMTHAILFTPPEQEFFAFEPASMRTDGFNALSKGDNNSGVFILAPEERKKSRTSFTVT